MKHLGPFIIAISYILVSILLFLFNYGAHKFTVFHDDKYYEMNDEGDENKDEK